LPSSLEGVERGDSKTWQWKRGGCPLLLILRLTASTPSRPQQHTRATRLRARVPVYQVPDTIYVVPRGFLKGYTYEQWDAVTAGFDAEHPRCGTWITSLAQRADSEPHDDLGLGCDRWVVQGGEIGLARALGELKDMPASLLLLRDLAARERALWLSQVPYLRQCLEVKCNKCRPAPGRVESNRVESTTGLLPSRPVSRHGQDHLGK